MQAQNIDWDKVVKALYESVEEADQKRRHPEKGDPMSSKDYLREARILLAVAGAISRGAV